MRLAADLQAGASGLRERAGSIVDRADVIRIRAGDLRDRADGLVERAVDLRHLPLSAASRMSLAALGVPRGPYRAAVERDLETVMPDGVTLLADRYFPAELKSDSPQPPVILVRSPYGRSGFAGLTFGSVFAQHGFQAVVQSVRGTFGSAGVFDPFGNERLDGLATVAWLKRQPWFSGRFATYGPSYLGYAQWAVAAEAGPELRAMAAQVTASQMHDAVYVGGAFALESTLSWSALTSQLERPLAGWAAGIVSPRRARRAALSGRPLSALDALAAGAELPFFQDLLRNSGPVTPYWTRRDHSDGVHDVSAPVSLLAGWYDVFLPWELRDYLELRRGGHRPQLTIGPWYHADPRNIRASVTEAVAWFRAHLLDDPSGLREAPVQLYITGAGEWRDYPDWPVPGMRRQRWHLQPGWAIAKRQPIGRSAPDRYRYDPEHPTPAPSGPTVLGSAEPEDNRRLEVRQDVLVYTSDALPSGLEIIGPVRADLYVRSNRACTDFVARLCDVSPSGASVSICEGIRRLVAGDPPADADGVRRVEVEMWPAGHRFLPGHRLRVQVASGAYPRVDRNPGTGEALGSGTALLTADQEVLHDAEHPSAIILPVTGLAGPAPEPATGQAGHPVPATLRCGGLGYPLWRRTLLPRGAAGTRSCARRTPTASGWRRCSAMRPRRAGSVSTSSTSG